MRSGHQVQYFQCVDDIIDNRNTDINLWIYPWLSTCLAWVPSICNWKLRVLSWVIIMWRFDLTTDSSKQHFFLFLFIWDEGFVAKILLSRQMPHLKNTAMEMLVTLAISHLTNYHVSTTWMSRAVNNPVSSLKVYIACLCLDFPCLKMNLKIFQLTYVLLHMISS